MIVPATGQSTRYLSAVSRRAHARSGVLARRVLDPLFDRCFVPTVGDHEFSIEVQVRLGEELLALLIELPVLHRPVDAVVHQG